MHPRYLLTALKLSLVAVCLAASGVAPAYAADRKVYAGASCVRDFESGGRIVYNSGVCNFGSTPLDVECPVIHDAIGPVGSTTYNIRSGWVKVVDLHPSSNISCTLHNIYFSSPSFTVFSTPTQSSSGFGTVAQQLSFGSLVTNGFANENAHYYYSCRIPPQDPANAKSSCVISYQVTEGQTNE